MRGVWYKSISRPKEQGTMVEQTKSKVEEKLKKEELKRANFIKLAKNRYKAAEKQVQLLMNLTAYAYVMDEDTAEEVLALLEAKVGDLRKEWETRLSSLNKKRKKKTTSEPTSVVVTESTPVVAETSEPSYEDEDADVEVSESTEDQDQDSPSAVLAGLLNPDRDN